jgi:hypothetical protein
MNNPPGGLAMANDFSRFPREVKFWLLVVVFLGSSSSRILSAKGSHPRWTASGLLRRLLLPVLVWMLALAGNVQRAHPQPEEAGEPNREYAIKAAYLYQFGRYVQWPAKSFSGDSDPLVIGVLGVDPFGGILEEIARTKRIEGRPIAVRRFASMAEYTPCHILFVNASVSPEQKAAAIDRAQKMPVLLVGEEPGFAERGGTVNFFLDENKIRFEINIEIAKQDQLKISSKLLSLARIVR